MKKFIIERYISGAEKLSPEELKAISQTSCEVVGGLSKPHRLRNSISLFFPVV